MGPSSEASRSSAKGRPGRPGKAAAATKDDVAVYGITSARRSQQADVHTRARRYMISMTIRLVCFIAAFVFYGHWYAWVAAIGAVFLPYVAVLMANAGRERKAEPPTAMMAAGTGAGTGGPVGVPAPRAITAVPRRTTPASDPWSDPRSAPPGSPAGEPRWQHSYAAPGSARAHTSDESRALPASRAPSRAARGKRRTNAS